MLNNDIQAFFRILSENGKSASEKDVPVGFVCSDSGKYLLKYSLSAGVKIFNNWQDMVCHVSAIASQ